MSALAKASFRYARRRLAVYQLAPGTKIPMRGSHGYKDASCDPDVTRARWQRAPFANIAIATGRVSDLFVLDVDPRHGGTQALAELCGQHALLPDTITVATPSGGRHYWFRTSSQTIATSQSRLGPGLDVLGEKVGATAPPSVLFDGRKYAFHQNGARAIADPPDWLLEMVTAAPPPPPRDPQPIQGDITRYARAAADAELATLEQAAKGCRNATLNRTAFLLFQLVKGGALDEEWTRGELTRVARAIGLPMNRITPTLDSAWSAAQPREIAQ